MEKKELEAWILSHYQRNPRVSEMVQISGYEQRHFLRKFKELFGLSPKQHLLNLRLDEAHRLIEQSGQLSHWLWMKLSFCDRSKFVNQYKRKFGETPLHHAKRVQGLAES